MDGWMRRGEIKLVLITHIPKGNKKNVEYTPASYIPIVSLIFMMLKYKFFLHVAVTLMAADKKWKECEWRKENNTSLRMAMVRI